MKKRRIFSIFCISLLIFAFSLLSGYSSFEKTGITNVINSYFDWFEKNVIDNNQSNNSNSNEEENNESIQVTITLDKEKIVF